MNRLVLILAMIILMAGVIGPFLVPDDPLEIDLGNAFQAPSKEHLLGTDNQGRDILSRLIFGSRISLAIGLLAALVSVLLGVSIGLIAGFLGGFIDCILNVFTDITLAFPSLLLAIGITVVLPPGFWSVVLALVLVGWAGFARFTRGIVWNLRNSGYVDAAGVLGASKARIMLKHIIPNCLPLVAVTGFLKLGTFILSEASLSFLGLGVPPPIPTWGGMINYGREFMRTAPWIIIFPGLALAMTVFVCNLLGDNIRDKLDPKNNSKKYSFSKG